MEGFEMHDINDDVHEKNFVYVVHGHMPEFIPCVATRRNKHLKVVDKKIIKCPYCRKVFRTIEKTERVELFRYTSNPKTKFHASLSCQTCRSTVGIIYASA